ERVLFFIIIFPRHLISQTSFVLHAASQFERATQGSHRYILVSLAFDQLGHFCECQVLRETRAHSAADQASADQRRSLFAKTHKAVLRSRSKPDWVRRTWQVPRLLDPALFSRRHANMPSYSRGSSRAFPASSRLLQAGIGCHHLGSKGCQKCVFSA